MIADRPLSAAPRRPERQRLGFTGLRRRRRWELHPGVRTLEELTLRDRASAWVGDRLGSWTFVVPTVALLAAGLVAAVRQDRVDGAVALLDVVLSGLVLVDLSILFMALRRADRTAEDLAMHHLDATRGTTAQLDELGRQLDRLTVDVARLDARIRTWNQPSAREEEHR